MNTDESMLGSVVEHTWQVPCSWIPGSTLGGAPE